MTTVCEVAFFSFLRCADFIHKCCAIYNDHSVPFLKQSKTDPFREKVVIKLFKKLICFLLNK